MSVQVNIRQRGMRKGFDPHKEIEHIQVQIKDYFEHNARPGAVAIIGMSGGKDSTIAGALLARALGPKHVIGVMMPDGEQADLHMARKAVKEIGIHKNSILINIGDITKAVHATLGNAITAHKKETKDCDLNPLDIKVNDNVTINTPPRIRMSMLYNIAAGIEADARVINTCNASEDYIGYSTKYGDAAGDYAILQDYTVSEIYAIGDALGLSHDLVHKKPSDGLCGLCDEDRFGFTYEELDEFIITGEIDDTEKRDKIIRMHNANLHKLRPMPKVNRLVYKYAS